MVDSWALMSAWKQLVVILATYLLGVFIVGPIFMRKRKPFQLINAIRAYNILQICFCTYSLFVFYNTGYTFLESFRCGRLMSDENFQRILEVWWIAVNIRLLELIETVFFVLRKKQNQVSILHVYHHIGSFCGVWFSLKYDPSEFVKMHVSCWISNDFNLQVWLGFFMAFWIAASTLLCTATTS